ncbi:Cysteine-rich receptor-like protein kinase 29 [Nymphaea thermarum]|nr:Cysteine-rich receptor-like protein kinase 29 [Nymphaea thermarum]
MRTGPFSLEFISAFRRADPLDGPTFDLATIGSATNDFAPENMLGEGGFGAVYWLPPKLILDLFSSLHALCQGELPDCQEIAVKRLSRNTVQSNSTMRCRHLLNFNTEILCDFWEAFWKVVKRYSPMREPRKRVQLDWAVRSKLINGIARGLLYLHEDSRLRTVHRDLKASNILLDEDMNPKISDFGTAKIFDTYQTQAEAFEIIGTRGYIAPEYFFEGKVSVKLDVFSFGVLLLEIISGLWMENKALQVVDRTLDGTCDNEILRCIHIGLLCVQEDASSRPKMSKVVAMLENSSLILPSILPPAPSIYKVRNISLGPQTSSTISGTGSEFGSSITAVLFAVDNTS